MHRLRSFKVKLVACFVVLAAVPLTAAFFGFSSVARRSEERRVDARVESGLRAALTAYGDELDGAQSEANALARDHRVQEALRGHDRPTLGRIAAASGIDVRFGLAAPSPTPSLTAARSVAVYSGTHLLGHVSVLVHLSTALLTHLSRRAGLDHVDRLVAARDGRVVLGSPGLEARALGSPTGRTAVREVGGVKYRMLAAAPLAEPKGISFVVLSPQSLAVGAASATERRLFTALLAALLMIALAAYVLSRSIVGRLRHLAHAAGAIAAGNLGQRVPVHGGDEFAALGRSFNMMAAQLQTRVDELETARRRLREANARFGEALEATHDPDQLREVIVETAVEATGAFGGILEDGPDRTVAGDPEASGERLELQLSKGARSFGRLVLNGPGFDREANDLARSLAHQAVIALDNARLHAIVERQALTDGLTGLANRRRAAELLHLEVSRASRLEAPLTFILADVDRFKGINDRFGHPAGDVVLRQVAELLAETVREIDVAGRWGGEEFALVLPGTDLEGGVQLAERLRAELAAAPIVAGADEIVVTASFGVAAFPEHASEEALVAAADAALYEAKASGRNRVVADGAFRPSGHPSS